MPKLVIMRQGGSVQIVLNGGAYVFERAAHGLVHILATDGGTRVVHLDGDWFFQNCHCGDEGYVEGFSSTEDLEACDRAVPKETTVVVVSGDEGQDALVFYGNGKVGMSRNGGDLTFVNIQDQGFAGRASW